MNGIDTSKVFIIAEAGVNHNGRLGLAYQLIDVAKKAGADVVKFQVFETEKWCLNLQRWQAIKKEFKD